jgi:putative oxidoreductase
MRIIAAIAGALLGLLFLFAAAAFFFQLGEMPSPPEGSPMAAFFAAFGPTGYLTFVKVLEAVGGVLVALPWTRRLGLLILGPIIVNILAFHVFVTGGHGLFEPMILIMTALALVLVWCERAAFAPFLPGRTPAP